MIQPRPYQEESISRIWNYFNSGQTGNPLIAYPTGTGKSLIPAIFIQRVMQHWPNQKFMMLTHVSELIKQNAEVLRYVWPNAPLGIFSAGLKQKQPFFPIVYAGIQSAIRDPIRFGHRDIIFIDEAHLLSDDESSQYSTFIATMKLINPAVKVIGMTATPFRMGMGLLTEGTLFTDIIHDLTNVDEFNKMIAEGYLCPLIPKRTKVELDVSHVGMAKGDFIGSQLQSAVDKQEITYAALRETVALGHDRKSWLIFSSGIEHAEHIAAMLTSFGIDCAAVHSKKPSDYNEQAIKHFKSNSLRSIVNYSKLTTGFNHPDIDLICDFRPTMSIPLHIQKLGRGTRPANGKDNCIAEGSLVLTDKGLIPIEKISLEMKLWDGVEFVSHCGIIYKGIREVITYAGLTGTMDHQVASKEGWKTLQYCYERKISIRSTGIGRQAIRETEGYFIANSLQRWNNKTTFYINRMSNLFYKKFKRKLEFEIIKSWMPSLRQQPYLATTPEMVTSSMYNGERPLYKQKQQTIRGLWRQGNKIQIFKSYSNGYLDYAKSWITQRITNRQNRKQWPLRGWKFKIFNTSRKYDKSPFCKISKKRVYDIINAGPRFRFTVNGLLVSNCLVLDFGRNIPRLGPINDPMIPRKKGAGTGEVPVKICENCGVYNHAKVRYCTGCGNEFEFKVKIVAKAGTEDIIRSDLPVVEYFDVDHAIYNKQQKDGKPSYIRVSYFCGLRKFNEFVFPESAKYGKHLFHQWWMQRHSIDPPTTTDDALKHVAELRCPKRIRVWVNKKWPEVLSAEY